MKIELETGDRFFQFRHRIAGETMASPPAEEVRPRENSGFARSRKVEMEHRARAPPTLQSLQFPHSAHFHAGSDKRQVNHSKFSVLTFKQW